MNLWTRIYGVDFSCRLLVSDQEVGWLSEEYAQRLKLVCLKTAVPADSKE